MGHFNALDTLREVYTRGLAGRKFTIPFTFEELEHLAAKQLPKKAFDYIKTGAGRHQGVKNNRDGFDSYFIRPLMARGMDEIEMSTNVLGTYLPRPFLFAPIGVLGMVHQHGDLELAKASLNNGVPMIVSNQASHSLESVAIALAQRERWFQLYFSKSYELVESLICRAEQSGYQAIVLTLDTTILGWRTLDLDNAFLPFLYGKGLAQYTSDPVFLRLLQEMPQGGLTNRRFNLRMIAGVFEIYKQFPGGLRANIGSDLPLRAVRKFIDIYSKTDLGWKDISWLRQKTKLPILLKGILRPEDAIKALDYGMDGIVVSNHGGRQIDQVISSVDALSAIKKVVPEGFPLILDSGIRTGTDVLISLALGAKAVLLGRPYVYALGLAGAEGVDAYVQQISAEFEIVMRLSGIRSINQIDPAIVSRK
ncbi:MAG: alpha-hydroxy-acid oxidizing protein [Saprospiraceae bacterium]